MSPIEIDNAILAVTEPSWKKVAMIIIRAAKKLPDLPQDEASFNLIAQRIEILVEEGKLMSEGDVSEWRFSEIKLP